MSLFLGLLLLVLHQPVLPSYLKYSELLVTETCQYSQIAHGGKQMVGQLGHGDTATYRIPRPIDSLHGIPIKQVACGDEFTACVTGWIV